MREFINGRIFNLVLAVISALLFVISICGNVTFMAVLFGMYLVVFLLHTILPYRAVMPAQLLEDPEPIEIDYV